MTPTLRETMLSRRYEDCVDALRDAEALLAGASELGGLDHLPADRTQHLAFNRSSRLLCAARDRIASALAADDQIDRDQLND